MMKLAVVCMMLRLLSGLGAEEQASTVKVRVGGDVTLQCPLLLTAGKTLSWYRMLSGQGPELVLSTRSRSDLKFGPSFGPKRVRMTADGSLVLQAAQRSDSGVYFCSVAPKHEQEKKSRLTVG
ncbi:hypothetical protein fugu_006321 [Takifugu bimaculatus]|uniref:Ig-like domain-containing protein n=1 Tax=Takifugu bimaculatus TaxID=433685 RepID=A0A4Z2BAN8_9TELE|nr:hypothetical protein fugu_006321 [Takifugu bimaculatus]